MRAVYGHTIPVLSDAAEEISPKCLYYAANKECSEAVEKEGPIKQDGFRFYRAKNHLWLVDGVSKEYIEMLTEF